MKKMQEEAIKQAKDVHAKFCKENKEEFKSLNIDSKVSQKNFEFNKKTSFKNTASFNFLDSIINQNDSVLIITLIILLMDDEKNFLILLILLYLII